MEKSLMDSFLNEFNKLKKNFLLPKFLWYYSFDDVEFDLLENITHKKKFFLLQTGITICVIHTNHDSYDCNLNPIKRLCTCFSVYLPKGKFVKEI